MYFSSDKTATLLTCNIYFHRCRYCTYLKKILNPSLQYNVSGKGVNHIRNPKPPLGKVHSRSERVFAENLFLLKQHTSYDSGNPPLVCVCATSASLWGQSPEAYCNCTSRCCSLVWLFKKRKRLRRWEDYRKIVK